MSDTGELFFPFDNFGESNDKSEQFLSEETNSNFGNVRKKDAGYVELILQGMGMEKHLDKFLASKISLETFLNLNQSDLINLGITDAEDVRIILDNLENHGKSSKDYTVPLDLEEDLIIAKNVSNHMVRLQAYAAYLVLKLTKEKFIDNEGDKLYSPARCLKRFTESAISQCDAMTETIYGGSNPDNLIKKLLKDYSLDLPKHIENKIKKEEKSRSHALHISAAISGILGVAIIAYFIKERLR